MEIKFNCSNPECRRRISVDESMAGQPLACPACATMLQVPASADIKFNCSNPDCGQHIVVDVSESGRFVKCPSCGKPLQVPGPPPKPTFSRLPEKETPKILPMPTQRPLLSAFKRLLLGWGMGAALFAILIIGLHLRSSAALPKNFNAMLNEISSIGTFRAAPIANHAGTELLYARETTNGLGFFIVDLATLQRHQIGLIDKPVGSPSGYFALIGWSPDDRYVAFTVDRNNDQLVAICDGDTGKLQKSFSYHDAVNSGAFGARAIIKEGVWLTSDSLVLMSVFHTLYLADLNTGQLNELQANISLNKSPPYTLTRISDRDVAYVDRGNIWDLDIATGKAYQLTQLTNATIEWLDYSPINRKFLFCMADPDDGGESLNRYLYQFDSNTSTLTRLTRTHTFKGQWIYGDTGIAYVGLRGTGNFLAIEPKDPALRTNLFLSGRVQDMDLIGGNILAYGVAPKKDKIYAVASVSHEPLGIWEYDIANRNLRNVVPGMERPFVFSKVIPPIEMVVSNSAGEQVPYYILPPAKLDPQKKYPVVIDQPTDDRCEQGSQFLANVGIYYVSVNRHGLASFENLGTAYDDVLTVYDELLKNPNIDPHRIYLSGPSASTSIVSQLVMNNPAMWRGMLLLSPAEFPQVPEVATNFPNIFVSIGEEDGKNYLQETAHLAREAFSQDMRMKVVYHKHASHIFNNTELIKERYEALAKFILTDY